MIGCFLDTIERTIKWSKNGIDFGDAYRLSSDIINPKNSSALYPTISLLNSTVEVNFGEKQFVHFPGVGFFVCEKDLTSCLFCIYIF